MSVSVVRRLPLSCVVLAIAIFLPNAGMAQSNAIFNNGNLGSGARALGMGGAFIAVADDATAASWNPAGLSTLSRPEVSFVQDFTRFDNKVGQRSTTNLANNLFLSSNVADPVASTVKSQNPDFASITYPLNAGRMKLVPQFSYRRAVKRNISTTSTSTSVTTSSSGLRTQNSSTGVTDNAGGLDVYAGSVAISPHPKLHFGAAFNYWRQDANASSTSASTGVTTSGSTTTSSSQGQTALSSNEKLTGISVDVGILVKPSRQVSFGFVFRSPFTLDRQFSSNQVSNTTSTTSTSTFVADRTEDGSVDWPRSLAVGAAFKPNDNLTLAVDFTRTQWTDGHIRGTFTSQTRSTVSTTGQTVTSNTTGPIDRTYPYSPQLGVNAPIQDSNQVRFGAEYLIQKGSGGAIVGFPIRGGVYRDKLLQPEIDGSSLASTGFTVGGGMLMRRLSVDVAFLREDITGRFVASTVTEITTGTVLAVLDVAESTSVFNRFILSTTVRF